MCGDAGSAAGGLGDHFYRGDTLRYLVLCNANAWLVGWLVALFGWL